MNRKIYSLIILFFSLALHGQEMVLEVGHFSSNSSEKMVPPEWKLDCRSIAINYFKKVSNNLDNFTVYDPLIENRVKDLESRKKIAEPQRDGIENKTSVPIGDRVNVYLTGELNYKDDSGYRINYNLSFSNAGESDPLYFDETHSYIRKGDLNDYEERKQVIEGLIQNGFEQKWSNIYRKFDGKMFTVAKVQAPKPTSVVENTSVNDEYSNGEKLVGGFYKLGINELNSMNSRQKDSLKYNLLNSIGNQKSECYEAPFMDHERYFFPDVESLMLRYELGQNDIFNLDRILLLLEIDGYIGDVYNCLSEKKENEEGRSCWEQYTSEKARENEFETLINVNSDTTLSPSIMIYEHLKLFEKYIELGQGDKMPPMDNEDNWVFPGTNYGDRSLVLWEEYYVILIERKGRLLDEVIRVLDDHFNIESSNDVDTFEDKLNWLKDKYGDSLIPDHSKILKVSNFRKKDIVEYK